MEPTKFEDEDGFVIMSTVRTYGDTTHTFVQRDQYKGVFLPDFVKHHFTEVYNTVIEPPKLEFIDHCVGNQPDGEMEAAASWYEQMLDFHRFWSIDDKMLHTEYSALRSVVVADFDEKVKMPINEPADGIKKSQIQEFIDYYETAGIQHLAFSTKDIISTVRLMRKNGVEFLPTPNTYYEKLTDRVGPIDEDINVLSQLGILVDSDENGYMLQIFTKPLQDRPTLFFEIIQRKGSHSFGKGNFKALFESIEREQQKRGNL